MKTLSATLLAAQKKPDRLPYVEAKVYDFDQGIKRLSWTRLYTGSEPDNHHGIAFDGQGSMHRIRAAAGNILYRQKVASPGPSSDYSQWTQLAADCAGPCAIAAYGAKVYIFYRTTTNVLWKYYSHDYGVTWSNAQLVAAYTDVLSMAACWWGTGNIVVCFAFKAGQQNGIVIDTTNQSTGEHTWLGSSQHPWGNNYGAGCYYTPDHIDLVVAAWEANTPYNLYGLYRQQFDNTYTFTDVEPFITSPAGEGITYEYPDCHKPASAQDYENTLIVGVEKFTGTTAYTRPLICHAVRGSDFYSMAFTEPKPFLNITSNFGLRTSSTSDYWWLERPDGVWRAPRAAADPLDLTLNILSLRAERSNLVIELDNSKAQFATPPEKRSEVVLKLGYKTTAGNEAVEVGRYWLDSWEYSSTPNTSLITLFCLDGLGLADKWNARFLMRWPTNKNVWEIIQEIICRWGINLTMPAGIPYSSASQNLYPDFTLPPGTAGDSALRRILAFIPDSLVFTGNEAYLKDPRADESSCYTYDVIASGAWQSHPILQGEYHQAIPLTRARAIGRDAADARIVEDAIDWTNLQLGIDTFSQDYDPNLLTTTRTQERADAILRKGSLLAQGGQIVIPTNVGQELYDVVTVTDARCGITSKKYRVMDIDAQYSRRKGHYRQVFALGAP
jgi:hypothetical protein